MSRLTAEETLRLLGTSLRSITSNLHRERCSGSLDSLKNCPIARFLKKRSFKNVTVFPTRIFVGEGEDRKSFPVPRLITDWINRFDQRSYRFLIKKNSPKKFEEMLYE